MFAIDVYDTEQGVRLMWTEDLVDGSPEQVYQEGQDIGAGLLAIKGVEHVHIQRYSADLSLAFHVAGRADVIAGIEEVFDDSAVTYHRKTAPPDPRQLDWIKQVETQ